MMKPIRRLLFALAPLLLAACKHPLDIEGQGDIVEVQNGLRGCSLEEFQAGFARCTDNDVFGDEAVAYRALPRPGWRFSHWRGICLEEDQGDCGFSYSKALAEAWDSRNPDTPLPPLTAVFVQDGNTLTGQRYITSQFGAEGRNSYGSLLDALLTEAGMLRYTTQQASSRSTFDRRAYDYQRQQDGLLAVRPEGGAYLSGGAATRTLDFLTLVDTDTGDGDISVAYAMQAQANGRAGLFSGTYYCAHISSRAPGYARFFRAVFDGQGRGALNVISDRWGQSGSAAMQYQVFTDGTTTLDYLGLRLVGGLSADGSVFAAAEIDSEGRGAGICLRASSNKTLGTVQGSYYGAWLNLQPVTAVTDILVDVSGQTAESVLRDSLGGRSYFLAQDFMLVKFDGRLETRSDEGAVSPDGRIMFIVDTNPVSLPRLTVYIKKG